MSEHLAAIAKDPTHPDWSRLRATLRLCLGRAPLSAFDWFVVLAGCPEALVAFLLGAPPDMVGAILEMDMELPLLWEAISGAIWLTVLEARKAALGRLLGEAAGELLPALLLEPLAALAGIRPHMAPLVDMLCLSTGLPRPTAPVVRESDQDPAQELLRRNLSDRCWPEETRILQAALGMTRPSSRNFTHSVLLAPRLAAAIATCGRPADPDLIHPLREARRFDPRYFETAYARACRQPEAV